MSGSVLLLYKFATMLPAIIHEMDSALMPRQSTRAVEMAVAIIVGAKDGPERTTP